MELTARLVVEGFISGLHKSPYQGFSVEFVEHRQYMPGDEIRYIDWKVYAKSDRFYVKKFEEETNLRSYIVIDVSGSMGYKSKKAFADLTKLEFGCYVAASLSYLMLKQRDSVGLATFDSKIKEYIPPRNDPMHLHALVSRLENTSPGNETGISDAFHELASRISKRGLIIIISDLFDDPQLVIKALKLFRHKKHEVIVFHILDHAELSFPFDGPTIFRDLETQRQISIEPSLLKDEYLKNMNKLISTYRNECGSSSIDYVLMDTSLPFDYSLFSYLSRRNR